MSIRHNGQLRIIAIDDDKDVLDIYRRAFMLFNSQGQEGLDAEFDIITCSNGMHAVEIVKEAVKDNDPIALIFLDLNLIPGPDGIWTGEQIRKLDPNVNFVIVTGLYDVDPKDISPLILPEDKILYIQKPVHIKEIRQFAVALGAKWRTEMQLNKTNNELEEKVRELSSSRGQLIGHKQELLNVNNKLLETNNALSVLARNIENARKEAEKRVLLRTRMLIIPIIEKLQFDRNLEKYRVDFNMLMNHIENITSDLDSDVRITGLLTSAELRIASLIKNGMSSREIAVHLSISPATVKTHRKSIRKKLNLKYSKINLKIYLGTQMGAG